MEFEINWPASKDAKLFKWNVRLNTVVYTYNLTDGAWLYPNCLFGTPRVRPSTSKQFLMAYSIYRYHNSTPPPNNYTHARLWIVIIKRINTILRIYFRYLFPFYYSNGKFYRVTVYIFCLFPILRSTKRLVSE